MSMKLIKSGQNNGEGIEKEKRFRAVEQAYGQFLTVLGYDWQSDPNMEGTPKRVAKMFLREITNGTYDDFPKMTSFPNQDKYDGIVFQGNIDIKSLCSHHMQPFIGKCHVAYIPGETVIGLSKINRLVSHFMRRPQLQEQLTQQIHKALDELLEGNKGVAVYIEASHLCVALRGVEQDSAMSTSKLSGFFFDNAIGTRSEFYSMVRNAKK